MHIQNFGFEKRYVKAQNLVVLVGLIVLLPLLTGCDLGNSNVKSKHQSQNSVATTIESQESFNHINQLLDEVILSKIVNEVFKDSIFSKYKHLSTCKQCNFFPQTTVYLYADGLSAGFMWSKPGAKSYGGDKTYTIDFDQGPVRATAIAHEELEGGRNYFYVTTFDGKEGWVGRPYVMKDAKGTEFLMPNPLTGEKIRSEISISHQELSKLLKSNPSRYIPSYESISWIPTIPEEYRRRGYEMYLKSLDEGSAKIDSLVTQYMSSRSN